MRGYSTLWTVIVDCIVLHYMHMWHLRIQASSLQFRASKINMALAQIDKLVKKLMSNPDVTWLLFPRITWYSLFHTSDLSVLKHSFLFCQNFCTHVGHIQDEGLYTRYRSVAGVTELSNTFCTSKFPICKYGLQAFICSSYF